MRPRPDVTYGSASVISIHALTRSATFAQGRFYYLECENNKIVIDEHRKYTWNEKTLNTDNPEVLKVDDHSVDALQYLVLAMAAKWGLRV